MSETNGGPKPLEQGRYAIFETPAGDWLVSRAVKVGEDEYEQQELIVVPAFVISIAKSGGFSMKSLKSMAKGLKAGK